MDFIGAQNNEMQVEQQGNTTNDVSSMMKSLMRECLVTDVNTTTLSDLHKNKLHEFIVSNSLNQKINDKIKLPKPKTKTHNVDLCTVLIFNLISMTNPRKILVMTKNKISLTTLVSHLKINEQDVSGLSQMGLLKDNKKMLFSSFFKFEVAKSKKNLSECFKNNFLTLCTTKILENPKTKFIDLKQDDLPDDLLNGVDCLIVYEAESLTKEERGHLKSKFKNVLLIKHETK